MKPTPDTRAAPPLRILYLEDNPTDVELVCATLEAEGFHCQWVIVRDGPAFEAALHQGGFNLVFADYALPQYDGISALRLVLARQPGLPFILISGTVGEEEAIESLKTGATDYVLKHRLTRLAPAVRRALGEAAERRRLAKLEARVHLQSAALESAANAIVITDRAGVVTWANAAFTRLTGYTLEEVMGQKTSLLKSGKQDQAFYQHLWETVLAGRAWRGEFINRRKDGSLFSENCTITPVRDVPGAITHFIAVKEDATERKHLETQLRHAQKIESMGRLASGIAHEINTPTQFIGDNIHFLQGAFADVLNVVAHQQGLLAKAHGQALPPELAAAADAVLRDADWDYLAVEIPNAIAQSLEGVQRVTRIVCAMKEFSHPGSEEKTAANLNKLIETTLTVCRNEWKYVAEVVTDFDPQLPPVPCLTAEINQMVLNLVVNAAHAIADALEPGGQRKGAITVTTRRAGEWAEIRIRDTGTGIPEPVREHIFEPFFTTKAVGKGTGQGLAIARSVVADKHGGTLTFETQEGEGTTFIIRLPLTPATAPSRAHGR